MEKFVQLPFIIPQLSKDRAHAFMEALLGRGQEGEKAAAERAEKAKKAAEVEARYGNEMEAITDVKSAARFGKQVAEVEDPELRERLQQQLSSKVSRLMRDPASEEVQRIIEIALEELDLNPRAIKRYLSLARLLVPIQVARGLRSQADTDRKLVLHAAHLLFNWPEFVHWLQNHPRVRDAGGDWADTAETIESIVKKADSVEGWRKEVSKIGGGDHPATLEHAEFCRWLRKITHERPGLTDMVRVGFL